MSNYVIPGTVTPTGVTSAKVIRLRSPIITPEELIAECEPPAPYTADKALEVAALALHELLRVELEGFPYREQLTHPRAVWARVIAVTLAGILSVQPPIQTTGA